MKRVVVADDSRFMILAYRQMFKSIEGWSIVAEARNGCQAVEHVRANKPDLVLMDVSMPLMDGLQAAREIMDTTPVPIIMISSLTKAGAETTMKALAIGAVDFIPKSAGFTELDLGELARSLKNKLANWDTNVFFRSGARPRQAAAPRVQSSTAPSGTQAPDIVLVGSSTGGPRFIPVLLQEMGIVAAPVLVAIHMPELYTKSFAANLSSQIQRTVVEGQHRQIVGPGDIVVVPGARDTKILKVTLGQYRLSMSETHPDGLHPSIDILLDSAAKQAESPVAVILTGMGKDGAQGAAAMRARHAPVLVQDPGTCVVGGMPQAVMDCNGATHVMETEKIGRWLKMSFDKRHKQGAGDV